MFKLNTLLLFCLGAALALPGLQAQNLFRAIEAEQVNFGPKSIERPDHFSAFETDHDALQNIIETFDKTKSIEEFIETSKEKLKIISNH